MPGLVLVAQLLQPQLDLGGDLLAADGQHLGDAAVADDGAHHGLVHVAERLVDVAHLEQELVRIGDPVLGRSTRRRATLRSPVSISDSPSKPPLE